MLLKKEKDQVKHGTAELSREQLGYACRKLMINGVQRIGFRFSPATACHWWISSLMYLSRQHLRLHYLICIIHDQRAMLMHAFFSLLLFLHFFSDK